MPWTWYLPPLPRRSRTVSSFFITNEVSRGQSIRLRSLGTTTVAFISECCQQIRFATRGGLSSAMYLHEIASVSQSSAEIQDFSSLLANKHNQKRCICLPNNALNFSEEIMSWIPVCNNLQDALRELRALLNKFLICPSILPTTLTGKVG